MPLYGQNPMSQKQDDVRSEASKAIVHTLSIFNPTGTTQFRLYVCVYVCAVYVHMCVRERQRGQGAHYETWKNT